MSATPMFLDPVVALVFVRYVYERRSPFFSNLTVLLFACENVEESKFKIWQITDTLTQMLSGQLQLQTLDYWGASTLYALLKTPCVSLLFPLFSLLFLGCFCLIFGRFWSGFPWQRAITRSTSPARLVGFWLFF